MVKTTNFCCWSHPVYGILLWQPKQTNIKTGEKKNTSFFVNMAKLYYFPFIWCCCKFRHCLNEVQLEGNKEKRNWAVHAKSLKLKFPSVDRGVLHDLCVLSTLGPVLEIDLLMQTKINLMKKNIYYALKFLFQVRICYSLLSVQG